MMLNVPVNSFDRVGMLPPFYGTCIQNWDAISHLKSASNITTQLSQKGLHICMDGLIWTTFPDQAQTRAVNH